MEANPKKGYTLLGTNTVIDQMKVVGLTVFCAGDNEEGYTCIRGVNVCCQWYAL